MIVHFLLLLLLSENITISIEGVEKLLDNINIHKASGPDKIPNIILKTCSKEISPALANIFQQSLDTGTLPNDWKKSNISPILKKRQQTHGQ